MRRPLYFIGPSLKELRALPETVKDAFGAALLDTQYGEWPPGARRFGEGLPREISKLAEDHGGDTYRAAFTVSFAECVYVLGAFKKKSRAGIATPAPILATIKARWQLAIAHHKEHYDS